MTMGELSSISNDAELERAIVRISELMKLNPKVGTPQRDELVHLAAIVERYEDTYYPVDLPAPIEALKFRLDQMTR
ncbi:MAG: hypothetical protein CMM61_11500 [Rhodospirillaceae bacterium]|nr:hypothetical protein [Rhodospirillaceae bacterium]